jgi:hypothetical protein
MMSKGIEAMIPDMCAGELIRVVGEKRLQIDFEDMIKELRKGKLGVRHVEERDLMLYSNLIPKIRKADRLLESSDVRILALSMADRECRGLLTFERKLIESAGLRRFIDREVNFKKGYFITDDPFRR